jgi:biotin carboxylase
MQHMHNKIINTNNMKEKTILVLPGSAWQIPVIKKIKAMGYRALVINPYENSPAFEYADGYLQADIFDKEKCLAYCKEQKVDAVLSEECDIAMPVVVSLAENLKLPSFGSHFAKLYTDKFMMREFSMKNGLNYPEYKMCKNVDETIDFFRQLNQKMIIKPLDSNSSRGVFSINCEEDIRTHFDEALSYSKINKAILAEKFIEGTEFTIDGIKTPKRHYSLAISEKKHFKHNKNIASDLLFSHTNKKYDYEKLKRENDKFVNLSGLPFGLTHAEYKYDSGKFYLIEIAARGGGNLISSDIVPYMSGIDNYAYLINCSLGKIVDEDFIIPDTHKDRCAVLKFFNTPLTGGKVREIEGIDYLESEPEIIKFKFNFSVGDIIEPAKNDAARIGFYIACSENMKKLEILMNNVDDKIQIKLEGNE